MVWFIIGLIILFLVYAAYYAKKQGIVNSGEALFESREMMLKFLATTYLANNDFTNDSKVEKLLSKFNISKEEVIKYAEEHKEEITNGK